MFRHLERTILISIAVASIVALHLYTILYTPASREGGLHTVMVPRGASFRVVARNLEKAGIIRDADDFVFAAGLVGAYKKVQAGEYELNSAMTPVEILRRLTTGRVKTYSVTIPEGYTLKEIAGVLHRKGLVSKEEFLARARNSDFVASLGLRGGTFEGYLFPDTYILTKGLSADDIIVKMVDRFKEVYNSDFKERAEKAGLTMREVVTLASIIEKETGVAEERKLISSVFHNRLKRGIPLQSDPTVIYAIKDFDGNLTKKHLLTKTPYNTYLRPGLPPGPIANPGWDSLDAAISPSGDDYLYFVSRNDGTHHFSKSLREHNRAVEIFQKGLKKRSAEDPRG